jgi:hypothetical protein
MSNKIKSRPHLFILLGVLALAMLGWLWRFSTPRRPPIALAGRPMVVHFYSHGHIMDKQNFASYSPQSSTVQNLIDHKQGQWRRGFASYAPQIHIQCGNVTIVFVDNALILNYPDSEGRPRSLIAPLTIQEYQSVRGLLRHSTTKPSLPRARGTITPPTPPPGRT